MKKSISGDILIGNVLIEAFLRERNEIEIQLICDFNEQINKDLKDYWMDFSISEIYKFEVEYPFLIDSIINSKLNITSQHDNLMYKLNRYFRTGLPNDVVDKVRSTSEIVFG